MSFGEGPGGSILTQYGKICMKFSKLSVFVITEFTHNFQCTLGIFFAQTVLCRASVNTFILNFDKLNVQLLVIISEFDSCVILLYDAAVFVPVNFWFWQTIEYALHQQ